MPFVTTTTTSTGVEELVLDGLALNDDTLGLVSVQFPPPRQRQEWIGAADSEAQLLVRNPLHENREITATIAVAPPPIRTRRSPASGRSSTSSRPRPRTWTGST
jgi:hypothetical protein